MARVPAPTTHVRTSAYTTVPAQAYAYQERAIQNQYVYIIKHACTHAAHAREHINTHAHAHTHITNTHTHMRTHRAILALVTGSEANAARARDAQLYRELARSLRAHPGGHGFSKKLQALVLCAPTLSTDADGLAVCMDAVSHAVRSLPADNAFRGDLRKAMTKLAAKI